MNLCSKILFFLLALFFSLEMLAQQKTQAISISILKENTPTSVGNFLNPFVQPYYIGGAITSERGQQKSKIYSFSHVFQLGYYHHRRLHQNIFLMWKPKFQWTIAKRFNLKLFPGVGYSHTFPTQATYELEDGKYQKKKNLGKPHGIISAGFGFGYNLSSTYEIFLHSEGMAILPYAPKGTIPIYVNTILSSGIKVNLK